MLWVDFHQVSSLEMKVGYDGNNSVGFLFLHKDTTSYIKLRSQLIGLLSSVLERVKRFKKKYKKSFCLLIKR